MTSKKKTVEDPIEETVEEVGIFAQLEAEALADVPELMEPYVINDVEPPIVITQPVEADRVVGMAILYNETLSKPKDEIGKIDPKDFHPLLKAVCGKAYERVWNELLHDKHLRVSYAFMNAVQRHFRPAGPAAGKNGAADVPGGSQG